MNIDEIINMVPLDQNTNQLAQEIINEQDIDKVKDLVHLFNLNQAKKNVLRVFKYNALLDKLSDAAVDRVTKHSDEFSNADIMSWMQVAQAAVDRANKSLNLVDETPAIQFNQVNNIKIEEPLSRESRDKIKEAVQAILSKSKQILPDLDNEIIIEANDPAIEIKNIDEDTVLNNKLLKEDEEEE